FLPLFPRPSVPRSQDGLRGLSAGRVAAVAGAALAGPVPEEDAGQARLVFPGGDEGRVAPPLLLEVDGGAHRVVPRVHGAAVLARVADLGDEERPPDALGVRGEVAAHRAPAALELRLARVALRGELVVRRDADVVDALPEAH